MKKISLEEIKISIDNFGWFSFGKKKFGCPGLKSGLESYMENNKLLALCDGCYKALLFWDSNSFEDNLNNFFAMLDSFEFDYRGKLNKGVALFYFRAKSEMFEFIRYLQNEIKEYDIRGQISWRRACREYQELKPELWRNAREFIPES